MKSGNVQPKVELAKCIKCSVDCFIIKGSNKRKAVCNVCKAKRK